MATADRRHSSGRCRQTPDLLAQQRRQGVPAAVGVDQEGRHRARRRHPQPAQRPGQLPTGLIDVLDGGGADDVHGLGVGRGQGFAQLRLQVRHRAHSDGHVEDVLGDLLQAALADAVAAGQVAQGGGQAGADAVGLEVLRGWGRG